MTIAIDKEQKKALDLFLFSKLHRLFGGTGVREFTPDFERTTIVANVTRSIGGNLESINGYFRAPRGFIVLPFMLTFGDVGRDSTGRESVPLSGLPQLAVSGRTNPVTRAHAFLSIIDYAIAVGWAPRETFQSNVGRITRSGENTERVGHVAEYGAFCERARQALPWDTANLILSMEMRDEAKAA
jgi:hypothetical protein